MKILIAIGGREFSKPTLDLGMKIANSFKSSTTIAYVGKKISQFSEKDVSVVHQNLDDRELYRPGIRTLEWAYDFLISKKYIEEKDANKFDDYLLVDEENSRMKVLLKGQQSDKIDLIMRTGEIIEQLKDEVETNKHDITIIGGGGNKGLHQKLVQFIDSSVFVVKNYSVNKKYKILVVSADPAPEGQKLFRTARRIVEEAKKAGHKVYVVQVEGAFINYEDGVYKIFNEGDEKGFEIDRSNTVAIIRGSVRLKKSYLDLVTRLEKTGITMVNSRDTIEISSDKYRSYIRLMDFGLTQPKIASIHELSS